MNALLLIQIFDNRSVFTGQGLKTFFSTRIGKAAAVENETAAVPRVVFGQAAMEGKAEDADDEIISVGIEALQFLRREHAMKRFQQGRQRNGQLHVVQEPAKIFQCVGHALEEVHLAFVESAESI